MITRPDANRCFAVLVGLAVLSCSTPPRSTEHTGPEPLMDPPTLLSLQSLVAPDSSRWAFATSESTYLGTGVAPSGWPGPIPPRWIWWHRICAGPTGKAPILALIEGQPRIGETVTIECYGGDPSYGITLRIAGRTYDHPKPVANSPDCVWDIPPDIELPLPSPRHRLQISFPAGSVPVGSVWYLQLWAWVPEESRKITSHVYVMQVGAQVGGA